jgi:predicted  nucleic acid-binding Zn-ribbon protein
MADAAPEKAEKSCKKCEALRQQVKELERVKKDIERDLEYEKSRRTHADETIEKMKSETNGEIKGLKEGIEAFQKTITEIASDLADKIRR